MSADIIQFADASRSLKRAAKKEEERIRDIVTDYLGESRDDYLRRVVERRMAQIAEAVEAPQTLTVTCRNQRLRLARRDAWNTARRVTEYWRARVDWRSALSIAQQYDVADSNTYGKTEHTEHFVLVDLWRVALVSQMLTPAATMADVAWKRAQLRNGQHRFTDAKPGQLQRAIDADVKWLESHPSRKPRAKRGKA
jgi:hypothetical protein